MIRALNIVWLSLGFGAALSLLRSAPTWTIYPTVVIFGVALAVNLFPTAVQKLLARFR